MYGSRYVRLAGLSLLAACAGAPGPDLSPSGRLQGSSYNSYFRADALPHRTVVQAPLEEVWRALPRVYDDLGYPGAPAKGESDRVFVTPNLQITGRLYEGETNSKYIDCGSGNTGPRADVLEVNFVIATRVTAQGASETLVETILDGRARERTVSTGYHQCSGTGELEKTIANMLMLKLGT